MPFNMGDCESKSQHGHCKPLFAPSVRSLPGWPAAQNLDRLAPWLKYDLLHAGYTHSGPQTRARRNVARGVEVQRGTRHAASSRGAARPAASSMHQFS